MLLDVVLPQRCVVCRCVGAQLCEACAVALPRIRPPLCERCGAQTAWPVPRCVECAGRRLAFASARGALVYDDRVRALVAAWKERGLRRLADFAADVVAGEIERPRAVAVSFVPADPRRRAERGHHPAAALAERVAARWQLPLARVLRRRPGPRQRGLSREERRRNVRDAFEPTADAPPRVVLVDDVYTSGETANAAAAALRRAGARTVHVVTFARVSRD